MYLEGCLYLRNVIVCSLNVVVFRGEQRVIFDIAYVRARLEKFMHVM